MNNQPTRHNNPEQRRLKVRHVTFRFFLENSEDFKGGLSYNLVNMVDGSSLVLIAHIMHMF